MSLTLDIRSDFIAIADNVETVSLTSQDGATVTTSLTGLKESQTQSEIRQGNAAITILKCRWHLAVSQLGTTKPEEHGYITDANSVKHYIDGSPSLVSWDTRWECQTTAQAGSAAQVSLS